jgi:dolichol-phosphate mannosyltransferase
MENSKSTHLSVVVPSYRGKAILPLLYERTRKALDSWCPDWELILINDASPDNDWEIIKKLALNDKRVKGIDFSRNFGQHYAITAGIEKASGEWIVVMDCDLQDQPEEIEHLYNKAQEGFDIVLARRKERQDNFVKRLFSNMFYNVLGYLTGTEQDSAVGNFGIYHCRVIQAILSMGDSMRYFPTMVRWVGFRLTKLDVVHAERAIGKTSYNFHRLVNLALDVMLAFSDRPLKLVVKTGFWISFFAVLFAFYNFIRYFAGDIKIEGWTSLIISLWFLSGLIVFVLGIIGLYVGKTFEKVKERPRYIIRESINE